MNRKSQREGSERLNILFYLFFINQGSVVHHSAVGKHLPSESGGKRKSEVHIGASPMPRGFSGLFVPGPSRMH